MVSEFALKVREQVKDQVNIDEGNCGTCHRVLREISEQGGYASTWERPDGIRSKIYDDKGNVVGEGEGITWPPAILFAMVEGGFFTPEVEQELVLSLQCIIDMEKVADIYGFGRVVTPVAVAYKEVWEEGGHVEIRRNNWGIEVVFYDPKGNELAVGPISYCPTCGTAAALPRYPELAERIKVQLKGAHNTGRDKYERNIETRFMYKRGRVYVEIFENGERIGRSMACCIAYTAVKAEIKAGISGPKWGALFKEYCRVCPVKLCRNAKSDTGRAGNLIISDLEQQELNTDVGINTYVTAQVRRDKEIMGQGIGTVCAFSSLLNAAAKSIKLKSELGDSREIVEE
jgi:hypothetical protein